MQVFWKTGKVWKKAKFEKSQVWKKFGGDMLVLTS
jgi:hypothetical protein